MKFSTALTLLSGLAVASAQQTFNVTVGANGLTFEPNQITAVVGDVVNFEFHPKNHTVSQSTFAQPCTYKAGGVDSGFAPVAADATEFPVWTIKVTDLAPTWFFCAQGAHCTSGMVFAINVNTSSPNTFDAYMANAKAAGVTFGAAPSNSTTGGTATGGATATAGATASNGVSASASATAGTTPNGAMESITFKSGQIALALMTSAFAFMWL